MNNGARVGVRSTAAISNPVIRNNGRVNNVVHQKHKENNP